MALGIILDVLYYTLFIKRSIGISLASRTITDIYIFIIPIYRYFANKKRRVNLNKDGPEPVSEDTISYYLKLNNVAYVTLHEILTSKQTWVGALNFLTCSRNDKNIKNLCITRAACHPIENGFAGTLPVIQYKSVWESSYIWQYDTNEDLSENIPKKFAIVPCFINFSIVFRTVNIYCFIL